jgi:hypothetical protein
MKETTEGSEDMNFQSHSHLSLHCLPCLSQLQMAAENREMAYWPITGTARLDICFGMPEKG